MTLFDSLHLGRPKPKAGCSPVEVNAHFQKWIGPDDGRSLQDGFIDVRHIPATENLPYDVIHTSGMSSHPLKTKKGEEEFAEFMMLLPPDGFLGHDPEWPVREMHRFAQMFHEMSAGVAEFITIPIAEPATGTSFSALMTIRPYFLPPMFHHLHLAQDRSVAIFALMPLLIVEHKYVIAQTEPGALWRLAQYQQRDPLELCAVDIRRQPVA